MVILLIAKRSIAMSQVRVFSLLGDSNVQRHVSKSSVRANPVLKSAQIIPCGHIGIFTASLGKIRGESDVAIISCLTNFITSITVSAEDSATVAQRVEPVLDEARSALLEVCSSRPGVSFMIAPPMYRSAPIWYREGLPEILNMFSQAFSIDVPENLHLLPSFSTPEFSSDGVHLTPFSGLEFISHLFDASGDVFERLAAPEPEVVKRSSEATRVLEDRVMAIEQDHRRLNRVVESKIAVDSEFADFRTNESMQDCFVISGPGLERLPSDIFGKEWQDRAVKDVKAVLNILMGRDCPIIVVHNSTRRVPDAEVTYTVRMSCVQDSDQIRKKFGSFFLGGNDRRPAALKPFSIKNRVTPDTKTRISVLKLLAKRYRDANPGSKVAVIGYDPRPLLKITPAASASDRRVQTYNYVQAVSKFPTNFTNSEVEPILKRINPDLLGKIRSIFIVLSDDQFKKRVQKSSGASGGPHDAGLEPEASEGAAAPEAIPADPEPAPPTTAPPSASGSRGSKRWASSSLTSAAKK